MAKKIEKLRVLVNNVLNNCVKLCEFNEHENRINNGKKFYDINN